jgi:hypothetical protein
MKKAALIILTFIVLLGISFLPFWSKIYKIFNRKVSQTNFSQLSVRSLSGDYEIYVDDKKVGDVKDKEQKSFVQIESGVRKVRLVRPSPVKDFFYTLERNIEFLQSSQVEIEWESGPTLESSSGTIKYFSKIVKSDGAQVYVLPFPNNSEVFFDNRQSVGNAFDVFDTASHTIRISNGEGFEPKIMEINLTDQNTKKVLKDIKLVVEVYIYKVPFK